MDSNTIAIISVNIGLFVAMATLVIWMVNKMDADVKSACARLDGHARRIDQLYSLILDILKEKK